MDGNTSAQADYCHFLKKMGEKMAMFDKVKELLKAKKKDRNIALLIDGPNVIRKDVRMDLVSVRKTI